jgi:lipopolysaccharide assembly protein A
MNAGAAGRRREPDGMNFLKTLFWVLVAVVVVLFASRNWTPVTLSLWNDIQADIKIPVLLFVVFLLGFLPTWLWMRARMWTYRRRIEALERSRVSPVATAPVAETEEVAE